MRTLLLSRQNWESEINSRVARGTCSNKFNRAREAKRWLVESYFRELLKHFLHFFFKNFTIFLRQFYLFIFFSSQCKVNYITFIHYWLWKEWIHLYLWCYTSTSTCSIRNDMVPNLTIPIIPSVNSFDMAPTTEVIRFLIIRFWGFSLVC